MFLVVMTFFEYLEKAVEHFLRVRYGYNVEGYCKEQIKSFWSVIIKTWKHFILLT